MIEFKGTPGPWERGGGENGGGELLVYCNNSLGSAICDATSHYSVFDKTTRIANLDLIAAAPELLEALQLVMSEQSGGSKSCGHNGFTCTCPYDKAKAAISKALGQ
jgi:hypothetical protein